MWVFACGRFRSGSTLQYQLVASMIERAGMGRRLAWHEPEEFGDLADEIERGGGLREMLVFKTHVCKHPMRERLRDGRALGVSVHRDLRDVAVSAARKAGLDPTPEYCRTLMKGLLACERGWSGVPGVLEVSYDALVSRPVGCCLAMADHLGVACPRARAESLAEEFAPDRQQRRIDEAVRTGRLSGSTNGASAHVEGELLHPGHLADGRAGAWRDTLPRESVRVIEEMAGEWLIKHGYALAGETHGRGQPARQGA